MSALVAAPRTVAAAAPARSVVAVLALAEARRLLRHPLTLLGFAWFVGGTVGTLWLDQGPRASFETTSMILTFFPAVLMILSANLLLTRDRRAGAEEMLAPAPGRAEDRFWALALASLAPALAGAGLNLALHAFYLAEDRYFVVPGFWHLATGPVTIVGACMFGAMIGLWVRARGAAVLGVVVMVVANLWLDGKEPLMLFGTVMAWARWGTFDDSWGGLVDGSPAWHVAYLVSLTAMAVAAGWLRVAARRRGPLVLGTVAVACAVLSGWAQLP